MDWYLNVLRNYIGFGGRARRKEYWMFILVNFIFALVLSIVDKILGWEWASGEGVLTSIYGLFILLPSWAVQFRRLHDTDRSAWWLLLLLIPIVGWIVILIFNCQSGTPAKTALVRILRSLRKLLPGGAYAYRAYTLICCGAQRVWVFRAGTTIWLRPCCRGARP